MSFPTSLLPLLVPLFAVPAVPLNVATGESSATDAPAPVTSAPAAPAPVTPAPVTSDSVSPVPVETGHRRPPSGCGGSGPPSYDAFAVGRVSNGWLGNGQFVGESDILRHVDAHGCHFWGTAELAGAVERVAASIAAERPGARLTVGELSKEGGGDIVGHSSHENGLDVDLGFYWLDERGRPYEPPGFVNVRRNKTTRVGNRRLTFDTARNWAIIERFLTDPEADLNVVVVHPRVRSWLLTYARTHRVDRELRRRAAIVLRRPNRGAHPHLNHFHLRIYCPEPSEQCVDDHELYAWVAERRASTEASDAMASGPGAPLDDTGRPSS